MPIFNLKIPLLQETAAAFQDSFGDTKQPVREIRSWIYKRLTEKGVEWSLTQGNGGLSVRTLDEDGKPKMKDTPLKEIDIEKFTPTSDPDWIPELWDEEDIQTIEMKIGSSLTEKLEKTFAVTRYITNEMNISIIHYENIRDVKTEDKDRHAQDLKKLEDDHKKYMKFPFEKFVHGVVMGPILERVKEHEQKMLDKEYDELYKEDDEKKDSEKIAGTREKKDKKSK